MLELQSDGHQIKKLTFEGRAIHSLMTSAEYTQLIDKPTLVISNSFSCTDLIFASHPNIICNSSVELFLADKCHHNLIFRELNCKIRLPPTYKRQVWDYS